jgi:cytochrome c peroxidase
MRAYGVKHRLSGTVVMLTAALGLMMIAVPFAVEAKGNLAPLNTVPVPLPPNLGDFVQDIPAAIELGKALFWDQQAGGDGIQACASCHFQAGSDARAKNTLNPGFNGVLDWVAVAIPDASLASQAVGPANNAVEMSCGGRTFPMLGRKLLGLTPLGQQLVAPTDSVLGGLSLSPGNGLNTSYTAMIQAAFKPEWWDSADLINGFTLMEQNFSLYWGLSIMLYESTLVSDDTRVDRFLAGNRAALNAQERLGMNVFTGKGRCDKCHFGGELTEASVGNANEDPLAGFVNVGLRPSIEDGGDILQPGQGMYKVPGPRNAELNGPYFHNGPRATLRQVVDFYDRGGDFRGRLVDGDVRPLRLTETEKHALVAFLVALTDDRVRFERAPFDHPSLDVPNLGILPAVGAGGKSTPLTTFLGLSPFQP